MAIREARRITPIPNAEALYDTELQEHPDLAYIFYDGSFVSLSGTVSSLPKVEVGDQSVFFDESDYKVEPARHAGIRYKTDYSFESAKDPERRIVFGIHRRLEVNVDSTTADNITRKRTASLYSANVGQETNTEDSLANKPNIIYDGDTVYKFLKHPKSRLGMPGLLIDFQRRLEVVLNRELVRKTVRSSLAALAVVGTVGYAVWTIEKNVKNVDTSSQSLTDESNSKTTAADLCYEYLNAYVIFGGNGAIDIFPPGRDSGMNRPAGCVDPHQPAKHKS